MPVLTLPQKKKTNTLFGFQDLVSPDCPAIFEVPISLRCLLIYALSPKSPCGVLYNFSTV